MDEKHNMEKSYSRKLPLPIYHTKYDLSPSTRTQGRSRRTIVLYALATSFAFLILTYAKPFIFPGSLRQPAFEHPAPGASLSNTNQTHLVPLEAHIMSKCPDAKTCLQDLVVPAMEQIAEKVDFRLSYIGKVDENDTIKCMHGSTECLGNMLGLCANELYPNDAKISLGFSTCHINAFHRET